MMNLYNPTSLCNKKLQNKPPIFLFKMKITRKPSSSCQKYLKHQRSKNNKLSRLQRRKTRQDKKFLFLAVRNCNHPLHKLILNKLKFPSQSLSLARFKLRISTKTATRFT
jgi:hypothetical protein